MSDELPEGWAWTSFREVFDRLQYGYTAKANNDAVGPRFLRITDIEAGLVDWTSVPGCEVDQAAAAKYRLRDGDFVFARSGSIEKACRVVDPPEAVFASYLIRGRPLNLEFGRWLEAFIRTWDYLKQIGAAGAGSGMANVNARTLGEVRLALPPVAEQRRIVDKIDALHARSAAARAALEAIPPLLDRFRQSVLAAAFCGDLTRDWRAQNPDVEPASVLLERLRAERRRRWIADYAEKARARAEKRAAKKGKPWTAEDDAKALAKGRKKGEAKYEAPEPVNISTMPGLPKGWCWTSIDEVSNVVRGASPRPAGDDRYFGGDVPWITVADITNDPSMYLDRTRSGLTEDGKSKSRYIPAGNLLLTNSGVTLGVPKITRIGGCINDGSVAMLGLSDTWQRYLWLYLSSQTQRLRGLNQGAAQPNLNTTIVRAIHVPLCPLEEGRHLMDSLSELLTTHQGMTRLAASQTEALDRLDQSILAKAFRGELVPQDPNDEPASALLERIRAEREAAAPAKKRRGRKPRKPRKAKAAPTPAADPQADLPGLTTDG